MGFEKCWGKTRKPFFAGEPLANFFLGCWTYNFFWEKKEKNVLQGDPLRILFWVWDLKIFPGFIRDV